MDEIKPLLLLIFSAFFIRQTLIFCGQGWAKSYSQTISFLVLPVITYVITITISGNIAKAISIMLSPTIQSTESSVPPNFINLISDIRTFLKVLRK